MKKIDKLRYRELIIDYLAKHNGEAKSPHAIMSYYNETNYYERFKQAVSELLKEHGIRRNGRKIILNPGVFTGMQSDKQPEIMKEFNSNLLEASKDGRAGIMDKVVELIPDIAENHPFTTEELSQSALNVSVLFNGVIVAWIEGQKATGKSKEEIKEELCRRVDNYFNNEPKRKRFLNGKNTLKDLPNWKQEK